MPKSLGSAVILLAANLFGPSRRKRPVVAGMMRKTIRQGREGGLRDLPDFISDAAIG
jgi:hypothetical protein